MNRLTFILISALIIAFIIMNNALWYVLKEQSDYFSYVSGRLAEQKRMVHEYPVINMGFNKNFCVDNKLNVHEVRTIRYGVFKSQVVHEVKP